MIKLVVIDFDDTLCLTEEGVFHLENEVAVRMGFAPMSRETHQMNWGKPLEEAIAERIPGVDPREFVKELEKTHMRYVAEGRVDVVPDNNLKALDQMLSSGLKLAILTSRSFAEAQHLLRQDHPLSLRIERFYHKDNLEFIKPDPKAFDQVLEDFNIKATEAIYVGDALTDGVCAKSAGLQFIAVLESGLRSENTFKDIAVDFFATTFVEAANYILND